MDKEKILKAGKIAAEAREFARGRIKKGMKLVEIADLIENKIIELGAKPAFPTCLSVDSVAAHYSPGFDDETLASGLLKIDMGTHIDGWIADTAFSLDLENSDENKKIIEASEKALGSAIEAAGENVRISKIGEVVENEINRFGLSPIINLTGHGIDRYDLHARVSIPNFNNASTAILKQGLYAIEPFSTTGNGKVKDGKPSGIYRLIDERNIRSPAARKILGFITEEYKTLPFCSRWLIKKFGTKALIWLRQLEENGNLQGYAVLVESSNGKVAQTEHTILIEKNSVLVTTE